jgi:cell division protein FtsB/cell division protein DivIC
MKRKPTPRKKNRAKMSNLAFFLAAFGMVFLLLNGIFGEWGLLDLIAQRKEKARLVALNIQLTNENQAIQRKIHRLKHDRRYIENIARRELGVVRDGEVIIEMRPKKKTKK